MHDQRLHRERLGDERAESLGEAAHELLVARMGGVQIRLQIGRDRCEGAGIYRVAHHRVAVAGHRGRNLGHVRAGLEDVLHAQL